METGDTEQGWADKKDKGEREMTIESERRGITKLILKGEKNKREHDY